MGDHISNKGNGISMEKAITGFEKCKEEPVPLNLERRRKM